MPKLHPLLLLPLFLLAPVLAQPPSPAAAQNADGVDLPLEPERWARFTTDEGTWISLDVSPDGEAIVFDLLGDLYMVPLEGGTATRLTHSIAHDMQPRFSPDGREVVFVSDRSGDENVWILNLETGAVRALTTGVGSGYLSPTWTPDGDYVVVSRQAPLQGLEKLWLYHVRGGRGLEMVGGPGALRLLGPAISDDPRFVWFAQRTGSWQYNAVLPQYQLGVYDRETGRRTVMSSRFGSAFRPALSPDGEWLTYGSRWEAETGLVLRELETGDERWLAYPIQRDEQESVASMDVLPGYAFTPDSREVVISYGGKIWRVPVDGSDPVQVPFTVHAEVAVGPEVAFEYPVEDTPTFTASQIRDPVPSPDGSRLAFTALNRLYVQDLPDGAPRRVTPGNAGGEFFPTWSPDGSSLAYVTWDGHDGHIMRVPAGGGTPRQLTRVSAHYQQPAWSPDGNRIVAVRGDARDLREAVDPFLTFGGGLGAEFVWVPADGGDLTVIGPTGGRTHPHFTRDPDRIYTYGLIPDATFQPGQPFPVALISTRWDGTDVKQHLRVTYRLPIVPDHYELPSAALSPTPWDAASDAGILLPRSFDTEDPRIPQSVAGLVIMAPDGDQALAVANRDIWTVTVPQVGGDVPTVRLTVPDSAQMPVRKLTDIGGEFPSWSGDGRTVHWALGNAFVSFDLDRAQTVDDSLRAAGVDPEEAPGDRYRPDERQVRVEVDRDIPRGTLVLRGARVITMRGDEVIENADVVIRDNRIQGVGPRGEAPADARIIDVAGRTIVPGFVDVHAHLRPIRGIHWPRSWVYAANLAYGVTTTRDPQTGTTDVLTYGDRVTAGEMRGPRIYSTGPGVFWAEGWRDLDHVRDVLRRYSDYWDTKTFKMYMAGNRLERQWLIMASRELGLMPTTEGGLNYRMNMTHAMDGYPGIEHNLPIIPAYGDVVELFRTSQTVNTPTLLVTYGGPWAENWFFTNEDLVGDEKLRHFTPRGDLDRRIRRRNPGPGPGGWFHEEEYAFKRHSAWLKDLVEAGGRTGVGSHGQLQGLGFHWELWALQSGGMTEHDALRAATLMGADAIGLAGDLGSIESGKLADLVVLEANPLDDIRNTNTVRYVMMNGRLYDGDTLDEIWPEARPAPDEPWRHQDPDVPAGIRATDADADRQEGGR